MKHEQDEVRYDVVVIGGGVLGLFAARNLVHYRLSVAVLEKERELCSGITKANSAIVYAGYDNKPDTLKSRLCVAANQDMARLCEELSVPFNRCGSLMVAAGSNGIRTLEQKYANGIKNGLGDTEFRIISGDEARKRESALSGAVKSALYSDMVGTINPWEFGLAAADNAVANGAEIFRDTNVVDITRTEDGYEIKTSDGGMFFARAIVNAAGIKSDQISELVAPAAFRIVPERADFIVLDSQAGDFVKHIIFCESEVKGQDVSIVPTVEGNILIGASEVDAGGNRDSCPTSKEGIDEICNLAKEFLPSIPLEQKIRSFAGLRPNPFNSTNDESIYDFLIGESQESPGFVNFIGVKTPGLTCANEIGKYTAELVADRLGANVIPTKAGISNKYSPEIPAYVGMTDVSGMTEASRGAIAGQARNDAGYQGGVIAASEPQSQTSRGHSPTGCVPTLMPDDPLWNRIVCRCRKISEHEVRAAIRGPLGARTLDGVKRRAGTCLGRCQGGYCTQRIIEILSEELGIPVSEVIAGKEGSWLLRK
jgi:glycerol-3-phosphate dehydrogenase